MSKIKGTRGERLVLNRLWDRGWAAIRTAGSCAMRHPGPDILAGNKTRRVAIEVKVTKETTKYFDNEEIESLRDFSEKFGAEPWVAVIFPKTECLFVSINDLESTKKGFRLTLENAKIKGMLLEEIATSF